jgi:hypothetical protein
MKQIGVFQEAMPMTMTDIEVNQGRKMNYLPTTEILRNNSLRTTKLQSDGNEVMAFAAQSKHWQQ